LVLFYVRFFEFDKHFKELNTRVSIINTTYSELDSLLFFLKILCFLAIKHTATTQ